MLIQECTNSYAYKLQVVYSFETAFSKCTVSLFGTIESRYSIGPLLLYIYLGVLKGLFIEPGLKLDICAIKLVHRKNKTPVLRISYLLWVWK